MDRSTVIVEDLTASPAGAAVLTLQRGVSTWASWTFQPSDAGTEISVGSSPGCDWQVAAPGMPSIELLFTGEELFAWIEQVRDEIRCNDATLPLGFTQLRHGDQLDLGAARILVSLGLNPVRLARPQSTRVEGPGATREWNATSAKVLPHAAELRVRRGASRLPAWTFSPTDIGKTVTVGAADECDVQIVAAGVEARELTVLYAGETLLVQSARPEHGPKLNGQYLTEGWQFLGDGDRLDMGTACIDVHFSILNLTSSGEREVEAYMPAREPRVEAHVLVREYEVEGRPPAPRPRVQARPRARERRIEARVSSRAPSKLSRSPASRTRDLIPQAVLCAPSANTLLEAPPPKSLRRSAAARPVVDEARQPTRVQREPERRPHALEPDSELVECLFAPAPAQGTGNMGRYAVALVAIASVYAAWLGLLDYWWPGW